MVDLIIVDHLTCNQAELLLRKKIKQAYFLNGHVISGCSLLYLFNLAVFSYQ